MIVCIGNPVYDVIETPYISTNGRVLSGCSTNACLALSRLGARTRLVGCIGHDYRERFVAEMAGYGIECLALPSDGTGGFRLIYNEAGGRTLDVLGIAEPVTEIGNCLEEANMILFGPILGETSAELVEQIRQETHAPLFLDPQGLVRRLDGARVVHYKNPELRRIVPHFEIVKANEVEAEIMTDVDPRQDIRAALIGLRTYGSRVSIITLAEAGSAIYDGDEFHRIPAYPTTAKDPTGAGDVYGGSFIYRYLRNGGDLRDAGYFASSAASMMVEHSGPDFPFDMAEIERRMRFLTDGRNSDDFPHS